MFAPDLNRRVNDEPFRPFRIHLTDGSHVDVTNPHRVIVSPTTAILPTAWTSDEEGRPLAKDWRTIILPHMTQFSELPAGRNGRGDKRPRRPVSASD